MPDLILHIGTGKTGTTSIQEFLAINSQYLQNKGFYLPVSLGPANHYWFPVLAYNEDRVDNVVKRLGFVRNPASRTEILHEKVIELENDLKANSNKKWIISSEYIHDRLTKKEEIDKFNSLLNKYFNKVTIVLYIRKPIDLAISMWSTQIVCGGTQTHLPPPEEFAELCDHQKTFERWQNVFNEHKVLPRLFEKEAYKGGNVIYDFCHTAGIHLSEDIKMPERKNETLSYQALKLLSRINKRIPAFRNNLPNPLYSDLASYFTKNFADFPNYIPSQEEYENFEKCYKASSEWVRKNYFPERESLWSKLSKATFREKDDLRFLETTDKLEDAFINSYSDMWTNKMNQIIKLNRRLKQQMRRQDQVEKIGC